MVWFGPSVCLQQDSGLLQVITSIYSTEQHVFLFSQNIYDRSRTDIIFELKVFYFPACQNVGNKCFWFLPCSKNAIITFDRIVFNAAF